MQLVTAMGHETWCLACWDAYSESVLSIELPPLELVHSASTRIVVFDPSPAVARFC